MLCVGKKVSTKEKEEAEWESEVEQKEALCNVDRFAELEFNE